MSFHTNVSFTRTSSVMQVFTRISIYLLLNAYDSGFDEQGQNHLIYSCEKTLLPHPFPELFLALPF